jgi:hypothetical protein
MNQIYLVDYVVSCCNCLKCPATHEGHLYNEGQLDEDQQLILGSRVTILDVVCVD